MNRSGEAWSVEDNVYLLHALAHDGKVKVLNSTIYKDLGRTPYAIECRIDHLKNLLGLKSWEDRYVVYTQVNGKEAELPQTNPCTEININKQEEDMNITIDNKIMINGKDVDTMEDKQLIAMISKLEQQVRDYEAIEAQSVKIANLIRDTKNSIKDVVEILDSRS